MSNVECRMKEFYPFYWPASAFTLCAKLSALCAKPYAPCSMPFAFFRIPHSEFPLPPSPFPLPTSIICLLPSALCSLRFAFSEFRIPTSNFKHLSSVYTTCLNFQRARPEIKITGAMATSMGFKLSKSPKWTITWSAK